MLSTAMSADPQVLLTVVSVCCLGDDGAVFVDTSVKDSQGRPSATLSTQSTATSADLVLTLTLAVACVMQWWSGRYHERSADCVPWDAPGGDCALVAQIWI